MDIIYQLPFPKEVCNKIFIFACKSQHKGLRITMLKKMLQTMNLNIPEYDEDIIIFDSNKITNYPDGISIDLSYYTCFHNLTYIDLNETGVTGDIIHFKSLLNLTHIYLSRTGVTGDIAHLKSLPRLTKIDFNVTDVTGDIAHLTSVPNLVTIHLMITNVTGDEESFRNYRWVRGEPYCAIFL